MNDIRSRDEAFDETMRGHYRNAATHVSAATRAQLRQARHAAASAGASRRRFGWPWLLGGATAAAFALAFGLGLYRETSLPSDATPPAIAAASADGYEDTASALDQDPDFYAWLGSADAELVAME